jgi:CheY-like chemotaxis protein
MMAGRRIKRLHFIDDSSDEHVITRILLKRSGLDLDYQGHETPDAFFSAMDELAEETPEIVVVDLNLVVDNGIDVVRRIKADVRFDGALVGICTGSEDPADRKSALDAGADFFVTKPLSKDTLNAIAKATGRLTLKTRQDGITEIYEHPSDEYA